MKPTCFCKPKVADCSKCNAADYSKFRRSSGEGERGTIIRAKQQLEQARREVNA